MKTLRITVNGTPYDVQVEEVSGGAATAVPAAAQAPKAAPAPTAPAPAVGAEVISSPMPGTIMSIDVKVGQAVKKGDILVILEAMKMENEIMAPHDATVAAVHVNKGDSVESGTALVSLQ